VATKATESSFAILVYSFSRAFRNQFEQELIVRALRKHKVELISFTEPLTTDASGDVGSPSKKPSETRLRAVSVDWNSPTMPLRPRPTPRSIAPCSKQASTIE
jgi:hypothetical protein